MTERIQNIDFSQCSEIDFVLSPRGNLRTRKPQTVGQLRIAGEMAPTFQLIEKLEPIELHCRIIEKTSSPFDVAR